MSKHSGLAGQNRDKEMTENEFYEDLTSFLCGISLVDDEDPVGDHGRDWWIENANVTDAEDCAACEGDLCPVHHGIALGIEFATKKIAALCADPELLNSITEPSVGKP